MAQFVTGMALGTARHGRSNRSSPFRHGRRLFHVAPLFRARGCFASQFWREDFEDDVSMTFLISRFLRADCRRAQSFAGRLLAAHGGSLGAAGYTG